MSYNKQFKMTEMERRHRHFSDSFKKQKVEEILKGKIRICDLIKEYELSRSSVRRWIAKFGAMKKKPERIIIETDSDTQALLAARKKIAELERLVGQKQIMLDFKDKMIDLAEEMYGIDIKKKFSDIPSSISAKTDPKKPSP